MNGDKKQVIKEINKSIFGKDVGSIIIKMLFIRCYMCRQHKEIEEGEELYNDTFICDGCIYDTLSTIIICSKCSKKYIRSENIECKLCNTYCLIYCNNCLYPKYYKNE